MKTRTVSDFFFSRVTELHRTEVRLADVLPGLAARAFHPPLHGVIAAQAMRSPRQLKLLSLLLRRQGAGHREHECMVMERLITRVDARMDGARAPQTRDLMIEDLCCRMGHYGMADCGFALRLARSLNLSRESFTLDCILAGKIAAVRSLETLEPVLFGTGGERSPQPVDSAFWARATANSGEREPAP